jgi:hypothetical protein
MTKHGLFLLLLGSLLPLGCGSSPDASEATRTSEASWVQQPVFTRMNAVVRRIDYLPFRYVNGGCHGRALYMAMELASEGLESNVIFAFTNGAALQYPRPAGGWLGWNFHVAPLLNVGPDAEHLTPMVIDPVLADAPLTREAWIERMGYAPGAPHYPTTVMVPGSDYATEGAAAEVEWKDKDLPDFAHLPPFRESDILDACSLMYGYIGKENPAPAGSGLPSASDKKATLLRRTGELVDALDRRGKLNKNATFSAEACKQGA